MNTVPDLITLLFIATTLFTVWMFYKASAKSKPVLVCISAWSVLQALISLTGFYQVPDALPPRFVLLIGPCFIFIAILFTTQWGKRFIDSLSIKQLTLMHVVRIPVEITLYFLFVAKLIPGLMTFEGNNFDIISGITAPVIFYLVYSTRKLNTGALLVWNFLCLGLLINVLVIAILSAQTPIQQLAFEQPNIGVTYFPYIWLPGVIVPLVLIAHLTAIRQLMKTLTVTKKK